MKRAILAAVSLFAATAVAQTCDYYPLTTCAQNILGKKTFYDGIEVPGGIVTDGGTTTKDLTVNGDAGVSGNVSIGGTLAGQDAGFNSVTIGTNLSDGGRTGGATVYGLITAADAGFHNVTLDTLTATSIPSFSQKILWSTPDPIQNDNNGGSNSRILIGPLTGVAGTVSSLNCQPQERGDGGGRLYVTMSEVTDGGITFLCAYDIDDCELTSVTSAQLGFKTLSMPGCSQTLSASSVYMYSFGQPTDGGSRCGLNTPILNCTTVINPP